MGRHGFRGRPVGPSTETWKFDKTPAVPVLSYLEAHARTRSSIVLSSHSRTTVTLSCPEASKNRQNSFIFQRKRESGKGPVRLDPQFSGLQARFRSHATRNIGCYGCFCTFNRYGNATSSYTCHRTVAVPVILPCNVLFMFQAVLPCAIAFDAESELQTLRLRLRDIEGAAAYRGFSVFNWRLAGFVSSTSSSFASEYLTTEDISTGKTLATACSSDFSTLCKPDDAVCSVFSHSTDVFVPCRILEEILI
jgi:hypothetical protein